MAAEEQPDRKVSALEAGIKQRCVTEFLYAENIAPTDMYQCLLNVYGDQTVDVSAVAVGGAFQQWQQ